MNRKCFLYGCIALFALLLIISNISCSPSSSTADEVVVTETGDLDNSVLAVHSSGESLLLMNECDVDGNVTLVTGAIWTATDGTQTVVNFDSAGLPTSAVAGDKVYLFENYNTDMVDITVFDTDGSYIVYSNVPIALSAAVSARTSYMKESTPTVEDLTRDTYAKKALYLAAYGLELVACAGNGIDGASVFPCNSALVDELKLFLLTGDKLIDKEPGILLARYGCDTYDGETCAASLLATCKTTVAAATTAIDNLNLDDTGTTTSAELAVTLTGDPDYGALAVLSTGEYLLAKTVTDAEGNITEVTGVIWTSAAGESTVVNFNELGVPASVVAGGYVYLFENYRSDIVDVVVINPDGSYVIYPDVPIESAPAVPKLAAMPTAIPLNNLANLKFALEKAANGLAMIACASAAVEPGPVSIFPCNSTLLDEIFAFAALDYDVFEGFTESLGLFGCGIIDGGTCVTTILDLDMIAADGAVVDMTALAVSIQTALDELAQSYINDYDGDGYSFFEGDCNDNDVAINPGATEDCDYTDNNCDFQVDEGCSLYYWDSDSDGFGITAASNWAMSAPAGFVTDNTDCDDTDASINPAAPEVVDDGIDQDCDGYDDVTWYLDDDGDGYGSPGTELVALANANPTRGNGGVNPDVADNTDCNDGIFAINPGRTEICDGGIDNNCDGNIDTGCPVTIAGKGGYSSIQAGINAARGSETVMVSSGTYYERIGFGTGSITVKSASGPASTIINGSGGGKTVLFSSSGSSLTLDGFTITNGTSDSGSGITLWSSSPTIINCVITGNTGNWMNSVGAGVMCSSSSPTFINCTISNNHATGNGGGVYSYRSSNPTFLNCNIINNTAGGHAGGIFTGAPLTIVGGSVSDNTAGLDGGGLYITDTGGSISGGTLIARNTSARYGGGIRMLRSSTSLIGIIIDSNTAKFGGGGISSSMDSTPTVTSCLISNNTATEQSGGGIAIGGGSTAILMGNQVTANHAPGSTGGGLIVAGADSTIFGNIFTNNTSDYGGSGVYFTGGSSGPAVTPTITGGSITGNYSTSSPGSGAGLGCYNAAPVVSGVDISGNTPADSSCPDIR